MDQKNSLDFHGSGLWAVILGGSSGFGLATAKRLARAGFNILIGHKDKEGTVETVIKPHFDEIRAAGVKLITHNLNLFDEDGRGELFESIQTNCGAGKVHLFMQSIAAGSCRLMIEDKTPDFRGQAIKGLAEALGLPADKVKAAVNVAFHDKGCDALHTLADSRIPYREELLTQEDLEKTIFMMGYDYLLWGRELCKEGLLTKDARLVAMTSEGNEVAWKGYAAVSAAKTALEASCRAMAVELAPYGVSSYIMQAGITDTPAGNAIPNFDLMKAAARIRNPFHRLTTPEDVAETILGLCGPTLRWSNGTIIRADGGEAISGLS
ncbi:MAG: SDR family oxidoreductase [Elusimicrobiota bacterium]|nr:SDR family oxidoreductase [Elusimicrobiota bacterium]